MKKIFSCKTEKNEFRPFQLTHFFIIIFLVTISGDILSDSDPYEAIEAVYKVCSQNAKSLKFVDLNFQSVIRKGMQVKKNTRSIVVRLGYQ